MRIIRQSDFRRMPWKNGGGETIEVAVDHHARGLDDFIWRVSMARVASDGPFSLFPAVDRTLCVLDGVGIDLVFDEARHVALSPASPPFSFPGDVAVTARLHAGPITDLNVMTRRGHARHVVSRVKAAASADITPADKLVLLLNAGPAVHVGSTALASGDCAVLDVVDGGLTMRGEAGIDVFRIDVWQRSG
ncbi:MAG: HutD/Ves family protein [Beijerinckiaceae bacterium]